MRRHLVFIVSAVLAAAVLGTAVLASRAATAPSVDRALSAPKAHQFVGYWMGIDPLDGGDSRRSITRNEGRTFSIVGRDTVFTLCDGTDRAIVTVGDAVVDGSALVSDELRIACFRDGSTVLLEVRYEVVDQNIVREVTTQDGEPVDEIIFHRVSER